jgi:hypothetical protein
LQPDAEHPSVRTFALAPGYLPTRIAAETGTLGANGEGGAGIALNTLALPAATMLYLTSGRADWLSGRFVHFAVRSSAFKFFLSNIVGRFCSANWDMAEVERDWKDLIVQKGGLFNKLYIPRP